MILLLDSNKEGILDIAPLELFRITQIALHYPFHESSSLIFHEMGCSHYFVVDRLEDLVDEGGSRSSARVREHGSFRLVSSMWQSRHSEVDVHLVERCGRTGWL